MLLKFLKKETTLYVLSVLFAFLFLYKVKGILLPFMIGIFIAFLIKEPLNKLEAKGYSRNLLAILFVVAITLFILIFAIFIFPILFSQLINLIKEIITFINKINVDKIYLEFENFLNVLKIEDSVEIKKYINNVSNFVLKYIGNTANSLLSSSFSIINTLAMLVISPITAYYFASDWKIFMHGLHKLVPFQWRKDFLKLFKRIDEVLKSYLTGQIMVVSLLGSYYAIFLWIAGLNYGFVIGLLTGLLTFIPYIGISIGMGLGLILGYFQFGIVFSKLFFLFMIFASGQFIEGNFVTPKLIGDKVKLHPLWVIFALFSAGSLFGFIGILLALPVSSVLGVVIRFYLEKKRISKLKTLYYESK